MGVGQVGYGPRRFRDIIDSTGGDFNEMLRRAADASADDVISGYAMFYGGEDPKTRARPNATPWTRIAGLGPAFFTKFLYFTTPGALILDNVLARKVHELSGIPFSSVVAASHTTGVPTDMPYTCIGCRRMQGR